MSKPFITKALRSELKTFTFGECTECHETIVWGQHKRSLVMVPLDPQPTHGGEMDRGYARHYCKKESADE